MDPTCVVHKLSSHSITTFGFFSKNFTNSHFSLFVLPDAENLTNDTWERIWLKLNTRSTLKNDFRRLAELMGFTKDQIKKFEPQDNPTLAILVKWTSQRTRTVDDLVELFRQMPRNDVVEILTERLVLIRRNQPYSHCCSFI